ncbi:Eukaryotic aspartyl protease [Aphelenchoides fujianensis]|nr:Eukaryotic aspartyl protease [Aphelenchoides fujianensis]
MLRFVLLAVLAVGLADGLVMRAPFSKRDTLQAKLMREKRYHEMRVLHRVRLANFAQQLGGAQRLDVSRQPFYDYGDSEYNIQVGIGTPPQMFEVLADTAEANTWVVDKTCDGNNSYYDCPSFCTLSEVWCSSFCEDYCCNLQASTPAMSRPQRLDGGYGDPCANKNLFDSSASSTYQSTGNTFLIPVGLGNVSGVIGLDTYTLGDISGSATIGIPNTQFGQADRLSVSFTGTLFHGVLGLGWPKAAFSGEQPVFQHAMELGLFDDNVFTIFLENEGRSSMDTPAGALTFGGFDSDHCDSEIYFIALQHGSVWWFNTAGFGTNGNEIQGTYLTLASLSTTINLIPPTGMMELVKTTKANYDYTYGFYSVDCSITFTWTVYLDDAEIVIDQTNLLLPGPDDGCFLAFASYDDDAYGIQMILGTPFLKSVCSVYDVGNRQIGFANKLTA